MRRVLSPGTVAMVMVPSGACKLPVLTTVPPSRVKFSPSATLNEPVLTIAPGVWDVAKSNQLGVPTREA